jgi:crotonobetainyl-CoA:carnitine CoA-transferase CaiB-like acyl-CoA transferase
MISTPAFLRGYRALDLTDLRGGLCGRILADLGMEIIKIEAPGGDSARQMPPFIGSPERKRLSTTFAHLNAGKASTVLDLRTEAGRDTFRHLVQTADVVIESFAPGKLESLGLGYENLAAINPRIVMASITGFGQTGPKKDFASTDLTVLALSGFLYLCGDPQLAPCKPPESQAYYFGSLWAAVGVLALLYGRERSGQGDHVDVSMQETLATQEHMVRLYANEGKILKRQGNQHGHVVPAKIFPCRDGYVYISVSRQHWKPFLEIWTDHPAEMESPEWVNDFFRRDRAEQINAAVEAFTRKHTKEELTNLFQNRGLSCVPVNSPWGFATDSHVRSRGFIVSVDHPDLGSVKQPAAPFVIDGLRPAVGPAPVIDNWREAEKRQQVPSSETTDVSPASLTQRNGPLDGMRVISFDHVLAGPYGAMILAELGADVIKVESRRGGMDTFRSFGTGDDPNFSARFLEFNRNKRSLTVNLKHPKGPKIILDLVAHSDAILDNYSLDVMPRLGLSYDDLRKVSPDIINLRMPGLGCTGEKKHFSTVGTNITSFTGLTYLWNHPGNTNPPVGSQTVYPDYASGVIAAILIISGALYRKRQKKGAFIDLAQAEVAAYMIGASLMEAVASERHPEPIGNGSLSAAPHGCYPCKGEDRWCAIAVETEAQWTALAEALGLDSERDQRFSTLENRLRYRDELDDIITRWTRERDRYQVMDRLQRAGVPCGVVQSNADLTTDSHLRARGFIASVEDQRLGHVVLPNFPLKFTNTSLTRRWEFPELGRDSEAILRDIAGYTEETIAALQGDHALE